MEKSEQKPRAFFKMLDPISTMCTIEQGSLPTVEFHDFYPFDFNLTTCGSKINEILSKNCLVVSRGMVFFEAHLKVLNLFCFAIIQKKLHGTELIKYVFSVMKQNQQISNYIRLFHTGDYTSADYESRIGESIGILFCFIYFSKQQSELQT